MSSELKRVISRRTLISASAGIGLISLGYAGNGLTARAATENGNGAGLFSAYPLGPLTFHNYMAPSSTAVVTAQIVETANELHIVDTQFIQSMAREVRDYADALGKPIAGVYLSHWHPDHVLGAAQFSDRPFRTTADVAADCETYATTYEKRKELFKDETPLILPKGTLETGATQWDGVDVVIEQIDGCEAEHAVTFHFPEAGLMIAQDLMFNNAHTFPLGNHENWIAALEKMRQTEGLRLVGCGHGLPATVGAISDTIAYLKVQNAVLGREKDAESAVNALTSQFPNYDGLSVLRFVDSFYK